MPLALIVVIMVMVAVVMVMVMVMTVIVMIVAVQGREGQPVLAAELLVAAGGIAIALAGAVFQPAADAFDMMVMGGLRQADLGLEAEHLFAVLAHLAVHQGLTLEDLGHPVLEGVEHQRG